MEMRRTTWSRSGIQLIAPIPDAFSSRIGRFCVAPGEAAEERQRVVAGDREPRLDLERHLGRAAGQGSGEHRRTASDRLGQNRIMARLVGEQRLEPLGLFRRQTLAGTARARSGQARRREYRRRSPRRPGRPAGRPGGPRWSGAMAIARSARATPRRYRRCAPAGRRIIGLGLQPLIGIEGDQPERLKEERVERCEGRSHRRAPQGRGRNSSSPS